MRRGDAFYHGQRQPLTAKWRFKLAGFQQGLWDRALRPRCRSVSLRRAETPSFGRVPSVRGGSAPNADLGTGHHQQRCVRARVSRLASAGT
jgi:hypothetical protein